jgi:hypothetical protein
MKRPELSHEELVLIIAESLIEPRFPEDALKEAESIAKRIEKRLGNLPDSWFGTETANIEDLPNVKPINGLNE